MEFRYKFIKEKTKYKIFTAIYSLCFKEYNE